MAEKDLLIKEKLEHSGLFSFDDLYSYAYTLLKEEGYGVTEEKYSEKHASGTKDVVVEWKCVKSVGDYFKVEISVKFNISGLADVEVEYEGKKKRSNKGRASIDIKGALVQDPTSKWNETPTYTFMRGLYSKYIIPGRIDAMESMTKNEVENFKEKLKVFFDSTGRR